MAVGSVCTHRVITVDSKLDIAAAASVMRESEVGYLIVVDKGSAGPAGVITDRDIVVKVMAKEIDPHALTVADVMTRDPLTARDDASVSETLQRMRRAGVRRVPVVGSRGQVCGVLSIDDVVDHLASQLGDAAASALRQPRAQHGVHR